MKDFDNEQLGRRLSRTSIDDAPRAEHRRQLRQQMLAAFGDPRSAVSWKTSLRYLLSDWSTIMSRPFPRIAVGVRRRSSGCGPVIVGQHQYRLGGHGRDHTERQECQVHNDGHRRRSAAPDLCCHGA